MATATLPYPNLDFTPLDILTASELDQMVANDKYLANFCNGLAKGTNIENGVIQAQKINPDSFLQSVEIEDNARKSYIVIGRLMVCWGQINVTDIPNGAFGEKTVKIEFPRWFSGTPQTIASIGDMGGLCGEYVTVQESSDRDVSLIVGHVGATSSSSCRVGWIAVGKRNF